MEKATYESMPQNHIVELQHPRVSWSSILASEDHIHLFNCNPSFNVCRVSVLGASFDCPPFTEHSAVTWPFL
jgi:hypothetical protein